MDLISTYCIVRIVSDLLVVIPGIAISVLLFRKPGYKHDKTRRWVDYTKIASGLWATSQVINIITNIILLVIFRDSGDVNNDLSLRDAHLYLVYISYLIGTCSLIALFLALFYLAHALTQLRTEGQEDSGAYRKGRRVVLGVSSLLVILNLASFCFSVSEVAWPFWNENDDIVNVIAASFGTAMAGILIICAIGSLVYSTKSSKKARGSAVQEAANILVVCCSLYLVRTAWVIFGYYFSLSYYLAFIDIPLSCWTTFVTLALLYVLAVREEYSLSKIHYRSRTATNSPVTEAPADPEREAL